MKVLSKSFRKICKCAISIITNILISNSNKYLEDPEILLNHKLYVNLYHNKVECIELFGEFMKECMMTNRFPVFQNIVLPNQISSAYFLAPIYETLKLMGEGKEKDLVANCRFCSTKYLQNDAFLNRSNESLVNTEYTSDIGVLHRVEENKSTIYYYTQFKISKFNVSHIDFSFQYEDAWTFLNSLPDSDEIKKEFSYITSTKIP